MMISCVMVTAMMGVAVTQKQGSGKTMHRMMFDQGIAQLSGELKQYVTACGCVKNTGNCSLPALGCSTILGPNKNNAGIATWYLNGAGGSPLGSNIVDSQGNVWALSCGGAHSITGLVPALEAAPYSGSISYTVTWPGGCNAVVPGPTEDPQISFTANWTEP